jgi:1-phosphofructokinase family hexose kinase
MIITVTPNTGIDYTYQISDLKLNRTIRSTGTAWGMGGKATDVSWTLGKLGIPTRALGFAAGPNGLRMEKMLQERGAETDFVQVEGETRLNTIIVVPGQGQSTITSSSLTVFPDHLTDFTHRFQKALEDATCVVMGGSLPDGVPLDFYEEVIHMAHERQVPVIFDSSGPSLAAGLKGRPDLIKPNQAELGELLGYFPTTRDDIRQAAVKLHQDFGGNVIVTLGDEGAIAVCKEGSYFIHPISVPVVSAAGAGDGVLAGMALADSRQEPFEQGLRYGFALAGAILGTLATADFDIEEYQTLLSRIQIAPL